MKTRFGPRSISVKYRRLIGEAIKEWWVVLYDVVYNSSDKRNHYHLTRVHTFYNKCFFFTSLSDLKIYSCQYQEVHYFWGKKWNRKVVLYFHTQLVSIGPSKYKEKELIGMTPRSQLIINHNTNYDRKEMYTHSINCAWFNSNCTGNGKENPVVWNRWYYKRLLNWL